MEEGLHTWAHFGTCYVFPSRICTAILPDHSCELATRRHAQSAVEAEISTRRPFGGATSAVLCAWITRRKGIVELRTVNTEALLAGCEGE